MTGLDAVVVRRIAGLPDGFERLHSAAAAEGFDTLSVLQDEWRDGSNRFDRPGEILAAASVAGDTVGVGGVTQDFVDGGWLRMRRFYVLPLYRRRGIGRSIALYVLNHARRFNRQIVLHADGPEAEAFWPTLGFSRIEREHTTHILMPRRAPGDC